SPIDGKLNKDQIGLMPKYLLTDTKCAQIRTRTGHTGIHPFERGFWKPVLHIPSGLHPIAVPALRNATTDKGYGDLFSIFGFMEQVGDARSHRTFVTVRETARYNRL